MHIINKINYPIKIIFHGFSILKETSFHYLALIQVFRLAQYWCIFFTWYKSKPENFIQIKILVMQKIYGKRNMSIWSSMQVRPWLSWAEAKQRPKLQIQDKIMHGFSQYLLLQVWLKMQLYPWIHFQEAWVLAVRRASVHNCERVPGNNKRIIWKQR